MTKKKQKLGKIAGFISKLIEILKNKQNQETILYNEQDRSFTIRNVRKFTQEILPRYFKHRNYSSFVRQVNLYDFHKIRHEGKEQAYRQEFFDINNNKQIRKIKRKPMGSEKNRHSKRDEDEQSDSEDDCEQMDEEYLESESDQRKSEDSVEVGRKQSINMELEDLQRKKIFLQNKIRMEQMANEKLEYENSKLKSTFTSENLEFYKETLKILENLLISQFNQGEISRNVYDKLIKYIYEQNEKLQEEERVRNNANDLMKVQQNGQKVIVYKQSKFLSLIKELLSRKKEHLTIPFFIRTLSEFIDKEENINHPDVDLADSLVLNSESYSEPSSQKQQHPLKQEQNLDQENKIGSKRNEQIYQNRQQERSRNAKEREVHDFYNPEKEIKMKKKNKKKEECSDDEQYLPKCR